MEQVMPDFITYLTNERNASKSTVSSYCRDLERMFQFLDGKGIKKTDDVTPISLNSYILYLEKEGFSISTVSRNVASMKAYFHYAFGRRLIEKDPTRTIKAPHIEKRVPGERYRKHDRSGASGGKQRQRLLYEQFFFK